MASPMVEGGRVEPHKKAHFSLHISDRIAKHDASEGSYSSVKYNHKPAQTSEKRSTKLTSSSTKTYNLRLEDTNSSGEKDVFTFTGQKSAPKKSYPLSSSYTFNLASKNSKDVSSQYPKIYPKKLKEGGLQSKDEDADLFGEAAGDDEAGDPDADNPYDFRHFLSKEKEKRGDESEYHFASSPDYRTGTGSAANTPQFGARRPAAAPAPKAKAKVTEPVPKKRKTATPNPMVSRPKKAQPPPTVRLDRRATDSLPKSKAKGDAPPASKIKSKELVDSSDDSEIDADGEASPPAPTRTSLSPIHDQQSDNEDEDAEGDSDDDGGLEIEVPDARPPRRGNGALASLGLGQNLGVGYLKSPSNGPISLASATSSAAGSPNPHAFTSRNNRNTQDEIDFGDLGGEDAEGEDEDEEDYNNRDIEPMDIGPPARQGTTGHEEDEDDLEKLMMEGLGGNSSEESEEE
ncbi:uncharacterized protein K460DRAFT_330189 [Cucurbitaria berberidis CBS 394.84]|uniref:Transcription elongation factor Eaf N-terminal domain-containing protein n=1 Tax=Cucurbitaria berberidis CBS 394.84 TaxID=1168544 RepID=A0A9P4LBQ8_9PLEO|nr:uncharacterized protein K460DRAFT_330189 [Cucurbitaria berberidis CBS 394.84]KAF1848843.1 hypothetical protein K460DRAFT_330189 [Cucurbitaria berberidis CBS 394.84]